NIEGFRHFGQGCDLAVCVSEHLADYVHKNLRIARTVVVPNGSDPDLYTPDAPVVKRLADVGEDIFNVLWIGSAYVAWHNFKLLGDAAQIIWDRGNQQNIVFHLIGQGMNQMRDMPDRKSTRLNSSHRTISYAVFCLKKKKKSK